MTTEAHAKKSRLEPEPIPRRDFLGMAAVWSAVTSVVFASIGALRLPKAAVLPSPSKKFRTSLPESLAPNEPYIPPGRSVALFRTAKGVYAVSIVCTHLGCITKPSVTGFDCPCHGSKFTKDGSVLRGPAPKALPRLAVKHLGGDDYLVDEGAILPHGTEDYA
jgi:cytochrome b6-f complex iron-sulfur subunit